MSDLPPAAPARAPMRTWRKVATVVLILLGVAAMIFALRSYQKADDDSSSSPEPTVSATPSQKPRAVLMSTITIENKIKARLDQVSGRNTKIVCPAKVKQKVGTRFDCDVFFADEPGTAAISTASVKVDGPDGHYTWKATPKGQ